MQGADLIGGHQVDGARRQDTHAVDRAAVANHFEKPRVVSRRRKQSCAAGKALVRTVDVMTLPLPAVRRAREHASGKGVDSSEPLALSRRKKELRVLHPERTGDPIADQTIERYPGYTLRDAAENVGVVAVGPRFSRLRHERQRAEPLHRRADRLVLVRGVTAVARGWAKTLLRVLRGEGR